jgi:hypothetical protein
LGNAPTSHGLPLERTMHHEGESRLPDLRPMEKNTFNHPVIDSE